MNIKQSTDQDATLEISGFPPKPESASHSHRDSQPITFSRSHDAWEHVERRRFPGPGPARRRGIRDARTGLLPDDDTPKILPTRRDARDQAGTGGEPGHTLSAQES